MADETKMTLLSQLESLQSMFNLPLKPLTQKKAKIVLNKLKNEFDCDEYSHHEEIKIYYNLITFLHYICRDIYEANQANIKSLDMDNTSIVALGNQAWIHYLEVTKLNENERFQARAWAQLGDLVVLGENLSKNIRKLFPETMETLTATELFQKANEINSIADDSTVFEMCANHWRRLGKDDMCKEILYKTIKVKKTSRACQMLAGILQKQLKENLKGKKPDPDNKKCQEIIQLYDSAFASQNLTALGYKGKFLMEIGEKEEAIKVFEDVYRYFQHSDEMLEEFNWKTKILCQTWHAKCLLDLSYDDQTITKAKGLLWSAIGLSLGLEGNGLMQNKLLKDAIAVMKNLLQNRATTMTLFENVALCELVGDKDGADKLLKEIGKKEAIIVNQPDVVRRVIDVHAYDEGLYLLNQLLMSNIWPKEMKEFAIKAQINGAINALEEGDGNLGGTRALAAFDLRFPKKRHLLCTQTAAHLHPCKRRQQRID
ncbi:hypothetical protein CHS0354_035493 [Potamilus streckersoni]|uniref:Uncharacterized protein n=1 Tax=Potamilus streckersoni TaxID=2493646 RepID=A0AAE0RW89_9BIVA|nr:hypothetical protein CHS0354_035493 [Potamilus streckersoni]